MCVSTVSENIASHKHQRTLSHTQNTHAHTVMLHGAFLYLAFSGLDWYVSVGTFTCKYVYIAHICRIHMYVFTCV